MLLYPTKSYFILLAIPCQYKIPLLAILEQKGEYLMRPLKTKVSITLDSDLVEKIRQFAEEDDRSFSQYINMVLRSHAARVDQRRKTPRPSA